MPSVVIDGITARHGTNEADSSTASEIADLLDDLITAPSPTREAVADLHERLADQRAVRVADGLVTELRRREPPAERVRAVGRHLAEHGVRRNPVKLGIVLLGVAGDERDRDLLLLLGAIEELTLFAVVALVNTQPDRRRTAYELARRVTGWGRIHAVKRLAGCTDPEITGWLLREGFRNDVMNEYLAHLAATTGDLYGALGEPEVDEALLAGAGAILAALAADGGPAEDLRDYDDAVPVLHRYAELAAAAEPTLDRLDDLLTIAHFVRHPDAGFSWPDGEPEELATRYAALLDRPVWRDLVRARLRAPVGAYGFNRALSCAGRLGVPAFGPACAHLADDPVNSYVWQWLMHRADAEEVTRITELAERLLPIDRLDAGPGTGYGFGPRFAPDRALEIVVNGLAGHPGAGQRLLRTALRSPVTRIRRGALRVLAAWPPHTRPAHCRAWIIAAAHDEPDDKLREELDAFLT